MKRRIFIAPRILSTGYTSNEDTRKQVYREATDLTARPASTYTVVWDYPSVRCRRFEAVPVK